MFGEFKTGTAQRQSIKNLQTSFFFSGFLHPTLKIKKESIPSLSLHTLSSCQHGAILADLTHSSCFLTFLVGVP